ncbi:hypothetical protein [Sansalvadorimonas verongulae]|uniref:hypothetical protein n=1 Tax=Sansalvadorimonas verongulae TaxID=2172824 RepID=UPI0012BC797D|nr:hypothetical protein [Sansalvadorimonas verongulae]MTI12089.1 hypothetical protein [Sansalvadorimonas verongulae]
MLQHRMTSLEDTPPRVNTLENTVTQLQTQVENISENIADIKNSGNQLHKDVSGLRIEVRRLFTIGATVAVIVSIIIGAAELYETSLSIQEKHQSAKELRSEHGQSDPGIPEP